MKARCYFSGKKLHLNKLIIFIIVEEEKKKEGVGGVYTFTYDTYSRLVNVKYSIVLFENVKIMCCILVQ
jgi:hypothetical protein